MGLRAISLVMLLVAFDAQAAPAPMDRIIAVVNDDVITSTELTRELGEIRAQLRQQNTRLPSDEVLNAQVLDRMILKRIQLQLAGINHIKIDDEALNRASLGVATQNKISLSELRETLIRDGYDFETYREGIRSEMTIAQLRQRQVVTRVVVTDQEIEEFLGTQALQGGASDEYRVSHILIEIPDSASVEAVDRAQQKAADVLKQLRGGADFAQTAVSVSSGAQALSGGDLGWRKSGQLPTLFGGVIVAMKVGDVSELIRSAGGFHIVKLSDKRTAEERHVVTQTRARHILLRTDELTSSEDARGKLEQLYQRIKSGDDFAELARSHSNDPGSAANGGLLGWVSPGDLVPAFEEVMNDLKPNDVSPPFRTQFGWHIVQVLERRDHDDTEELKKNRAREQIRQRKIEDETQTWLRQLRDEAYVEIRK